MIFIKKKIIKTGTEKYDKYRNLYGHPQLTSYGEHVWQQAIEKFVKDAKTGRVIERTREVKYLGRNGDQHYYLGEKSKLLIGDRAHASFTE